MDKRILFFSILLSIVLFFPVYSLASAQIPPTAEGPGLILPDSPLFFIDKLKQSIRLSLAFTPKDKARVYNSIAGERFAELRYMLARQNRKGIEEDLSGISDNLDKASENLYEAQFRGENVEKLSEDINNDIKRRQDSLSLLLSESSGDLKTMVLGVQTSVYQSKTKVVMGLPLQKVESETREDLMKQIDTRIKYSSDSTSDVLNKVEILRRQASESAAKSIMMREDEVKAAGILKNKSLLKEKQARLDLEKKKQEKILAAYRKLSEAAKKAREAITNYQNAQKELNQLLNQSPSSSSSASK